MYLYEGPPAEVVKDSMCSVWHKGGGLPRLRVCSAMPQANPPTIIQRTAAPLPSPERKENTQSVLSSLWKVGVAIQVLSKQMMR